MPLDSTGAPAPRSLTQSIERLKRAGLAAKKGREVKKRQRVVTERRIAAADELISDIVHGSDVIGRGLVAHD
jgi:hypothetical protein